MTQPEDSELLLSAQKGDNAALERLLLRHQSQIYRFGMKMCGNPEDAKDVLQDSLLAMARSVRNFRGESSFSTWLYSIARSFCVKKHRKSKFAPEERSLDTDAGPEIARLEDSGRRPDAAVAALEIQEVIENAIRKLEPDHREVLILRDVEGLTAAEVGDVLGISVEAVKSRLHRARSLMREYAAPALGITPKLEASPKTSPCPDLVTMFSSHLEGDIDSSACAAMEQHLQGCERCRNTCDSLKKTLSLCRAGSGPEVPSAVQESVRQALRLFLASRA